MKEESELPKILLRWKDPEGNYHADLATDIWMSDPISIKGMKKVRE
jgi:hypothetical protein